MRVVGKWSAAAVAVALVTATPAPAAPTDARRARAAVRYIVSQQNENGSIPGFSPEGSTADAVVSMVAARRGPRAIDEALDYLTARVESGDAIDIGTKAKIVMAAVAGGRDPRAFGGANLVSDLRSAEEQDGRYGAGTPVFHHALVMLALRAADARVDADAEQWLADAQCDDGGWQFDEPPGAADDPHCLAADSDFFISETDATALAVQALESTRRDLSLDHNPFRFFRRNRDEVKGGWGYSRDFPITSSNSTGLVIQAFAAAGRDTPPGAPGALRDLQYRLCGTNGGAFAFTWENADADPALEKTAPDVGATIGAIPGLLSRPFPIGHAAVTKPAPRLPAC
jgi:hypothetical protein